MFGLIGGIVKLMAFALVGAFVLTIWLLRYTVIAVVWLTAAVIGLVQSRSGATRSL